MEIQLESQLTTNQLSEVSTDVDITQVVDAYIATGQQKPYYEDLYYVADIIDTTKLLVRYLRL